MKLGTVVICTMPPGHSVTYGEGEDARTIENGTIGVVTEIHPALPACGPDFPAEPEWYSLSIDGVQCVAIDKGDRTWKPT